MNTKTLIISTLFSMTVMSNSYAACSGYACDGKDPNIEKCSTGAITVATAYGYTPRGHICGFLVGHFIR
jgi:hypothetical protein